VKKQRADSFVVETNIHYPTESSLIVDGVRKTIELCVKLSDVYDIVGWRQHEHLLKKVKQTARQNVRISARKGAQYKQRFADQYGRFCGAPKRYSRVPPKRAKHCVTTMNSTSRRSLKSRKLQSLSSAHSRFAARLAVVR